MTNIINFNLLVEFFNIYFFKKKIKEMEETFGPHITLDLKGCPKEILSNYQLHFEWLKKLPELIQMTPITQPYVFPYSGLVPEDKGITGIVIIAESHLSIHSFEEKGWSFIDIFSCKDFDVQKAVDITVELFKPTSWDLNVVKRGKDFPH
jgi:S-adenosylmethionine decarboxylase